jgi:hypothetical protein
MPSSQTRISVDTPIPDEVMGSFERYMLGRILEVAPAAGGACYLHADGAYDDVSFAGAADLASAIALAEASDGRCAQLLLPMLRDMASTGSTDLYLNEVGDGDPERIDYVDILADLVDRFPDILPAATVSIVDIPDRPVPGGIRAVTIVVTPGSVQTLHSRAWAEERTDEALEARRSVAPSPR